MTDTICNRTFDEISLGDSASLQRTLTRADISTFAVMSGDANPSHVDEEFARSTPFHEVVAHGMWSGMLLSNLLGTELPGPGTVYVDQSLSFDRPVMLGDTVTASVTAREKMAERHQIRFDCKVVNQRGETIVSGQALVQAPTQKTCRPRTHLPQLHLVDPGRRLLALVSRAREGCKGLKPMRVAVVHPVNEVSIQGAIDAAQAGLIEPVWIGPEARIRAAADAAGIDLSPWQLMPTEHSHAAAALAVELARSGKVGALMKGALHTDELMHAAFDAQTGLRTGRRASHVFVIDAPAADRLLFITDAAINIAPDLDTKRDIAQNAIELAQALGVDTPRMAILAAVETVNANMAVHPARCRAVQNGRPRADHRRHPRRAAGLRQRAVAGRRQDQRHQLAGSGSGRHPAHARSGVGQYAGQAARIPRRRDHRRAGHRHPRAHHPHQPGRWRGSPARLLRPGRAATPGAASRRRPDRRRCHT